MASSCFPDIGAWIENLPPFTQWRTNSMSICLCSSSTSSQPSLNLVVEKTLQRLSLSFAIIADFEFPISLWASKPFHANPKNAKLSDDEEVLARLLHNLIEDILSYGKDNKNYPLKLKVPRISGSMEASLRDILNVSFLTLTFLLCIFEAPMDIRYHCLNALKVQLAGSQYREATKVLMRYLGSIMEEQWVRALNLAITNWIVEEQQSAHQHVPKAPSSLFSYAVSAVGLWKVQLYCPIIAMDVQSSSRSADERLLFSLRYHQLEGVLQFNHRVFVRENWIDVTVNTDNIRCDITRLVNEALLKSQGAGTSEKHFPSRISLQLTPWTLQSNVISISVSKSSENPITEIGTEKTLEASLEPPTGFGLTMGASEAVTKTLKPWKFEQSVYGNGAILNWFLHDSADGKEVFSSKPSKMTLLLHPKAWFKNRYSKAYRPFTRQGGIIFARDEYGDGVQWKVCRTAIGQTMQWEVRGWVWLTYWPNKHRTFYNETRRLEFKEILHLTLA